MNLFARPIIATFALALSASAGWAQLRTEEKATVDVVADRTAYQPGETVRLAAQIAIEHGWHMNSHTPSLDWLIATELQVELPDGAEAGDTLYPDAKMMSFSFFPDQAIAVYEGDVTVVTELTLPENVAEGSLEVPVALYYQACDDNSCLPPVTTDAPITLTIGAGGVAANEAAFETAALAAADSPSESKRGLLGILLLGLIGGLILNAMPCVLPVLSLKLFGIVHSAEKGRRHLVAGSMATVAGVLVSFWALAGVAVLARAAGNAVGWGSQFQQPAFVAFLTVVVVLFSLNMWGLFEVPLPAFLNRVGGQGSDGLAGHFASGLFATLMATPCSAPFLGTAVGFALAQSAGTIFAVFTAVGLGLALPYLLLAIFPRLAHALPKPGNWMVTLRGVLGFFLAAAAVWLFFVLAGQIGAARLAAIQLTILALALFVWLRQRVGTATGRVVLAGIAAAGIGAVALAAGAEVGGGTGAIGASAHHDWLAFDEREAQSLAAGGKLVFVDVTADWCLTCKTNEWRVLETDTIDQAFDRHGVITMKADWTNRNDAIATYLAKFGRSSIPFYVLYRPGKEPHVFSELLSKRSVLDALDASVSAVTTARN